MSPEAAAFARGVITQVAPAGRERAKNLLWAAGKLADYAASLGLELSPGVVPAHAVLYRPVRLSASADVGQYQVHLTGRTGTVHEHEQHG